MYWPLKKRLSLQINTELYLNCQPLCSQNVSDFLFVCLCFLHWLNSFSLLNKNTFVWKGFANEKVIALYCSHSISCACFSGFLPHFSFMLLFQINLIINYAVFNPQIQVMYKGCQYRSGLGCIRRKLCITNAHGMLFSGYFTKSNTLFFGRFS